MLNAERERETVMSMKAKSMTSKRKGKGKAKLLLALACLMVVVTTVAAKGNQHEMVGYTYDTGSTVWDMAVRHCPKDMDIRVFVDEIEKANDIKNSVVYEGSYYKIPIFKRESEIDKSDYLDMTTVVGYEVSDSGVMLITNDGNGYFIEG